MNAEKEKPGLQAGLLRTDYDDATVTDASLKVNGKPMPPDGYAKENGELVPVTLPQEPFAANERERLDIILPVLRWAIGSKSRVAALEYLGGLDRRPVAELAKFYKISPSVVHREVRALRAFLGAMRP